MYTFSNAPKNFSVKIYATFFSARLLQLILLILGIRAITILMKKSTKFSTFEKQLLSLLILKCVYEIVNMIVVG